MAMADADGIVINTIMSRLAAPYIILGFARIFFTNWLIVFLNIDFQHSKSGVYVFWKKLKFYI